MWDTCTSKFLRSTTCRRVASVLAPLRSMCTHARDFSSQMASGDQVTDSNSCENLVHLSSEFPRPPPPPSSPQCAPVGLSVVGNRSVLRLLDSCRAAVISHVSEQRGRQNPGHRISLSHTTPQIHYLLSIHVYCSHLSHHLDFPSPDPRRTPRTVRQVNLRVGTSVLTLTFA